ncbi:MAG: DUF1847 domain-containing protein [Methanoregula sp.]|jgi:uncharacterized metal-binding protein|nr:DUF1847 domain-containing protein [Methanoregula sp.]
MSRITVDCSKCQSQACWSNAPQTGPSFCPTKTRKDPIEEALGLYQDDPGTREMAIAAARTEGRSYMKWTRVEDTIDFAREMGYKKLGVATCIGLMAENRILHKILTAHGFHVVSVCCKCGAIPKEDIGLLDSEKAKPGTFEPICNPVAQAKILEEAGTEFNILLGLCVGHDTLFMKHSKAPVTTLVAKDRITCHNPNAVLHGTSFYYKRLLHP